MDYTTIGQIISKAIVDSTESILKNAKFDKSFRAIITSKVSDTVYKVKYNGTEYKVSGPTTIAVGNYVWVCAPQNDWNNLFVMAIS